MNKLIVILLAASFALTAVAAVAGSLPGDSRAHLAVDRHETLVVMR